MDDPMGPDTVLVDARIVTPERILDPGWVSIGGSTIVAVGAGHPCPPTAGTLSMSGRWVLPGFIDIHVHGGGGHSLMSTDPAVITAAAGFHRRHGTTRLLASLVAAPVPDLLRTVGVIADLTSRGVLAGGHLEGPFLSRSRCGAQDPRYVLDPDLAVLDQLLDAGRGAIRVVTVAPERPGAVELIRRIVACGVVAAIGHTDATYAETMAAIDAGARVATHLFNAMRPMHHREPGPIVACLDRPEMICEIVADGVHLHPATISHVAKTAGAGRVALVTDATAAAGMAEGRYSLGSVTIEVEQGVARDFATGAIAGSTLTMDEAVRHAVGKCGLTLVDAVEAACRAPAGVLELADRAGSIQAGSDADLVVLDDDLKVAGVMVEGRWTHGGP